MGGYGGAVFFGMFVKKWDTETDEEIYNKYSGKKDRIVLYFPYNGSWDSNLYLILNKTFRCSQDNKDFKIPKITLDQEKEILQFAMDHNIPFDSDKIGWYFVKTEVN